MPGRMNKLGATAVGIDAATNGALLGLRWGEGCDVFDDKGSNVARLEEIVIDARTGCVRHAIIAVGGVLGIGRRRMGISWTALTVDMENRRWRIDVTLMQLTAWSIDRHDGMPARTSDKRSGQNGVATHVPASGDRLPVRGARAGAVAG